MRLRDALSSPSLTDIIYSCNDRGAGEDLKKMKLSPQKQHKHKPIDRSRQGAALAGTPNVPLDTTTQRVVRSASSEPEPAMTPALAAPPAQKAQKKTMQLTLKGLNKKGTTAIYAGTLGAVRIGLAAFPGKVAPAEFEVADGLFAVKAPRVPKVKLTKEERAALPKPTEAEKIAKMEERLAKARAKLAAKQSEL